MCSWLYVITQVGWGQFRPTWCSWEKCFVCLMIGFSWKFCAPCSVGLAVTSCLFRKWLRTADAGVACSVDSAMCWGRVSSIMHFAAMNCMFEHASCFRSPAGKILKQVHTVRQDSHTALTLLFTMCAGSSILLECVWPLADCAWWPTGQDCHTAPAGACASQRPCKRVHGED